MNHKTSTSVPVVKKGKVNGLKRLIREVESDDEDDNITVPVAHSDMSKPWMTEFTRYLETLEATLAGGMSQIHWWGVSRLMIFSSRHISNDLHQINAHRYPVWASLACDYLSIMASSVSSERAFSQGGITISKRRNRLKGDIVEALQCVKCAIRHDLLFREAAPSSLDEEKEDEYEANDPEEQDDDVVDEDSWDDMFLEEDEDDFESDAEMGWDN
jgi:hypothetical protein